MNLGYIKAMEFVDRTDGGKQLADLLGEYKDRDDVVVYALPRGGVVTGVEVAKQLHAPLDLLVPRKIGHPNNAEYAICALTPEHDLVCDSEGKKLVETMAVKAIIVKEAQEAKRRIQTYLGNRSAVPVTGKIAIIVDDGVATGLTMRAAIASVKHRSPAKIIVAVPVIPDDSANLIENEGVKVIAVLRETYYKGAVGSYYKEFPQVEDARVRELMAKGEKT